MVDIFSGKHTKGEKPLKKILNKLPPKEKLASLLSLSITLCFTVILFVPMDMYLNNPIDFMVSWKFLILPLVVVSLIGAFVIAVIFLLLWNEKLILGIVLAIAFGLVITIIRFVFLKFITLYTYIFPIVAIFILVWILLIKVFKKKAMDAALLLAWGGAVCAYIQMLFFNGEMVRITGDVSEYSTLTGRHIINMAIWVMVTVFPLCLYLVFRAKRKVFRFEKILLVSMILICGMQIAGLVSTSVSTELPLGYDEDIPSYFTYESILHYSADENIIVFILDRLDGKYMVEVLEEYPELYEQLDGFTFYRNNVSETGSTFPAITTMLTQYYYVMVL